MACNTKCQLRLYLAFTKTPCSAVSVLGLQINKVFQQFVKRVQQDVWERDFGSVLG